MFNLYPYNYNLQSCTGFSVYPVGKIEEVKTIFPDLQGKPLFFFDQSRNEFFVKQRNVETGEVQILRYTPTNEPLKTTPDYYEEQIKELKNEIERINSTIGVKVKKGTNNAEQSE